MKPARAYTRALVSVRSISHEEKVFPNAVLTVQGVTARYRGTQIDVLTNVTLDVAAGQRLAVVRKSGSGKSTLARVFTGLPPAAQGRIQFAGRVLSPGLAAHSKDDPREVQMIHQMADTAMNPRQNVRP